MPLYRLLKKSNNFEWTNEADVMLKQLKDALTSAPILVAPRTEEPMLLYIAATNLAVSVVMVVERKAENADISEQRPVYFINEVFSASKQRYQHYQKLAYGVFYAASKLGYYFQEHYVTVMSKAPLGDIINNADATGQVTKWGIELTAFDINYKPRNAIRSQALANFVADSTEAMEEISLPE